MKRTITIVLIMTLVLSLVSCGNKANDKEAKSDKGCQVAMIVDGAELEESSFSKDTWDSVKKVSDENDLKCKYLLLRIRLKTLILLLYRKLSAKELNLLFCREAVLKQQHMQLKALIQM